MKTRLDKALVDRELLPTRSQAESYIKLGSVNVNGKTITKPGYLVAESDDLKLTAKEQYVSRAGLKLASVSESLRLDFKGKVMLDVGSSTGGFTDFALQHGAKKVIAVEVGTNQLHPSLRQNPLIELHEKTDIRDVCLRQTESGALRQEKRVQIDEPDIIVIDVSFISLREILPHVSKLMSPNSVLVSMLKPQFEAGKSDLKHKGVIKNDAMRRRILKDFEAWAQKLFVIKDKSDSEVSGAKGNTERFYLLKKLS